MKIHVCDICKKNIPDAKIKYKYRAKKQWTSWYESGWEKIELCQECLDKIIKEKEEGWKELPKSYERKNDLVSKQDAIDAIKKDIMGGLNYESILKALPAADVHENVHGKWIPSGGSFRCSECASMPEFKDIRRLHFCPNCGIDMRAGGEQKNE